MTDTYQKHGKSKAVDASKKKNTKRKNPVKTTFNKREIGSMFEKMAADYLESQGVTILERNYRCRMGELDLIAREDRCLIFAEVKYRNATGNGSAAEAVDFRKQRTISRVASFYLMSHYDRIDFPCRFDVLAIEQGRIYWYKNAFDYCT